MLPCASKSAAESEPAASMAAPGSAALSMRTARAVQSALNRSRSSRICPKYASTTLCRADSAWLRAASFMNQSTAPVGSSTPRTINRTSLRMRALRDHRGGEDLVEAALILLEVAGERRAREEGVHAGGAVPGHHLGQSVSVHGHIRHRA